MPTITESDRIAGVFHVVPDIHLDGEVERLQSSFINGVKHIPVAFTPGPRVTT